MLGQVCPKSQSHFASYRLSQCNLSNWNNMVCTSCESGRSFEKKGGRYEVREAKLGWRSEKVEEFESRIYGSSTKG